VPERPRPWPRRRGGAWLNPTSWPVICEAGIGWGRRERASCAMPSAWLRAVAASAPSPCSGGGNGWRCGPAGGGAAALRCRLRRCLARPLGGVGYTWLEASPMSEGTRYVGLDVSKDHDRGGGGRAAAWWHAVEGGPGPRPPTRPAPPATPFTANSCPWGSTARWGHRPRSLAGLATGSRPIGGMRSSWSGCYARAI
jgi:hypothetical protein